MHDPNKHDPNKHGSNKQHPEQQGPDDLPKHSKSDGVQNSHAQESHAQNSHWIGLIEDLLPEAEPSPEFATKLKQRLDAKCAAAAPAPATPSVSRSTFAAPGRRRFRKGVLGFLATATALLAIVFWPAPSAYSFESICRKMNSELFVHVRGGGIGERLVGWISGSGQFAAVESSRSILVSTQDEPAFQYQRNDGRVTSDSSDSHSSQSRVFRLMNAIQAGGAGADNVLKEQGRSIEKTNGADYQLDVTLADDGSESGQLQVRFGIDSETGLPQWFRWLESDGTQAEQMEFGYPQQGPADLVSLGIPNRLVDDYLKTASTNRILDPTADLAQIQSTEQQSKNLRVMPTDLADSRNGQGAQRDAEATESARMEKAAVSTVAAVKSSAKTDAMAAAAQSVSTRKWRNSSVQMRESIPDSTAMAAQIDRRLYEVWEKNGLSGQPAAARYTLFRRLHLDLAGRIPRVSEIRDDQQSASEDVKSVVDTLLDSPDFDSQMASVWTQWLLPPDVELEQFGGTPAFKGWLRGQFAKQVPYDEIVRTLLTAEGRVGDVGPVLFTTALELNPEHLAKQTARTFLGTRIDCAMCHDHPYDDWTQTDFWGYAALFARISRPKGKMNLMSSVLSVRDVGHGEVTLPDSDIVIAPKFLGGELLQEEPQSNLRRQRLATWLTSPDNQQFARATVNLIWSHFFGAGIVEPRDDFGQHNPPLSEELLDEMAGFFVKSNYDVREVIRAITLSKTYRQSSLAKVESNQDRPMFDSMPIRWLNAEQLYDCLVVASGGLQGTNVPRTDISFGLNRLDNSSRDQFVEEFRMPGGSVLNFQAGIPQALSLMNGSLANRSAGESTSGIVIGLEAPFFTDRERIETVFLSVVGRPPSDEERKAVSQMLEEAPELPTSVVLSDLVWALLNGAEFATNH